MSLGLLPLVAEPPLMHQRGSDTSKAAAECAVAFARIQRERLYGAIAIHERHGLTQKEAHIELAIERASLCFRFRELERAGRIRKIDDVRKGCHAYVVVR